MASNTYFEQEHLKNENTRLQTEVEQLTQNLSRLEFLSPSSVEGIEKKLDDGKKFVYIFEEVCKQFNKNYQCVSNYKLGVTAQSPTKILADAQPGNPRQLSLMRCEVVSSFEEAEKRLKLSLKEWQVSSRGDEWYLVPDEERPQFYGKFYGTLHEFGVKEPIDIPKGWLRCDEISKHEDRVWIASGGVFYHSSNQCSVLRRKGRKYYPIIKTRISEHKRRPCHQCVSGIIDRPRSLSFSQELLQKISY